MSTVKLQWDDLPDV
uniref:Uncharacterized protein n=1 Tax=Arundo donax TaxID=35708 RepID=A0A0A9FV43_ARUDO